MNKGYFINRGIGEDDYKNTKIPAYLDKVLPKNKNAKILDIGCGLGQILLALKKEGYTNIKGIDISEEAIQNCREKDLDVYKITNLKKFCKSSTEKYDFIIMSHVLEHIDKKEIITTLKLIRNYLMKKNSILQISVPNAQSNTGCYWAYEDFTHTTLFTVGSLLYVLRSAGFEDIEILDKDCTEGTSLVKTIIRKIFLKIYENKIKFWNKITNSSYHKPSPKIFSFQIKILAKK